MPFTTPLDVRRINGRFWQLLAPLDYQGKRELITIPAGFITDFATVPWWSRWLTPSVGTWTLAAVLHDQGCDELNLRHRLLKAGVDPAQLAPCISSRDNDGLFRRVMREEGTDPVRQWVMWTGVRWGALGNAARQEDWWKDAPAVLAVTAAALVAFIVALAALVLVVLGPVLALGYAVL